MISTNFVQGSNIWNLHVCCSRCLVFD